MNRKLLVLPTRLFALMIGGTSLQPVFGQRSLEMFPGAGNPTGNGPDTTVTIILQNNTNNPTGNSYTSYSPTVTITYTLSNQQYTSIEGNTDSPYPKRPGSVFGGDDLDGNGIMDGVPLYPELGKYGYPSDSFFTSSYTTKSGQGINVASSGNRNHAVEIFNANDALLNSTSPYNKVPVNSRVQFADLTITFNRPVSNPVVHLSEVGATSYFYDGNAKTYQLGVSTEFELLTSGITLSKLSGTSNLNVTGNVIKNRSAYYGGNTNGSKYPPETITRYAAAGTVVLLATNITKVTFRMYLKGDGGRVVNSSGSLTTATPGNEVLWSNPQGYVPNPTSTSPKWYGLWGDAFTIGVSMELPVIISGTIFHDQDGLMNKTVDGVGTNTGGLNAILIDMVANEVIASEPVAADGTYSFVSTGNRDYSVMITNGKVSIGAVPPAALLPTGWVNTGENIGPAAGNDGIANGVLPLGTVSADLANANFGIENLPTADPKTYTVDQTVFSATPPSGFPLVAGYKSIIMSSSALTGYATGGALSGTDQEDCPTVSSCNTGTGTTFKISAIKGSTTLYYDFGGTTGVQWIDVSGGAVSIPNFDYSKMAIYGAMGSGTIGNEIGFIYSITDKAGFSSDPVDYLINTSVPLPIRLMSFEVRQHDNTMVLNWTTASELNSQGFNIQKSTDVRNWNNMAFVSSKSELNNNFKNYYSYTDTRPVVGNNYYRLQQLDVEGDHQYSPVRIGRFENSAEIRLFPNPGEDYVIISGLSGNEAINMYDPTGKRVKTIKADTSSETISLQGLSKGLFFVKVTRGDVTVTFLKLSVN